MPHQLFRELHREELDRRDSLRAAVGLPLGLLGVVCGALGSLFTAHPMRAQLIDWVFWWSASVALYLIARGAFYLVRAYHGEKYRLLAPPDKLLLHYDALREWHQQHGDIEKTLQVDFDEYVLRQAAGVSAFNRAVNNNRSEYLFRANSEVVFCVIFAFVAYFAHLVVEREDKPDVIYSVRIEEPSNAHRKPTAIRSTTATPAASRSGSSTPSAKANRP